MSNDCNLPFFMPVGLHVCSRSHHPRVSAVRHRVEDAPDRSEPPPTKTFPRGSAQAIFHEAVPRVLHPDIQEPHLSVRECSACRRPQGAPSLTASVAGRVSQLLRGHDGRNPGHRRADHLQTQRGVPSVHPGPGGGGSQQDRHGPSHHSHVPFPGQQR